MNTIRATTTALALTVAAPLALSACGGSSSSSSTTVPTGGTAAVTVIGKDNFFEPKQYAAKAGSVTITMDNKGNALHDLLIKDPGGTKLDGFKLQVAPGKSASGQATLTAGTYQIYCDIPGHDNMKGQIIVS